MEEKAEILWDISDLPFVKNNNITHLGPSLNRVLHEIYMNWLHLAFLKDNYGGNPSFPPFFKRYYDSP